MKNKIKELKNKKIENMTNDELRFIIENDKTLVACQRLDFSDFTLYQINRKDV